MKSMPHLAELLMKAKTDIEQSQDLETLESARIKFLGKKGFFTRTTAELRHLLPEARPAAGLIINQAKREFLQALAVRKGVLEQLASGVSSRIATEALDTSLPGRRMENGGLHPVTLTTERIENFFIKLGFSLAYGPEIEDDYHNFDALNIPLHHPARTEHDTFWFDTTRLLRTQTSGLQIRSMKAQHPPIRIIASGRVYRNDYDQTHTPMFHQIEGLLIDRNVSFSNLLSTINSFLRSFFEEELQIRFRSSYFPFTEPSAEVDMMGNNGRWLEILGCGMVHPNVLCNVGIDPDVHSGFAFGMGIERLAMLRYGVQDLRTFFENDLRFLKQFK